MTTAHAKAMEHDQFGAKVNKIGKRQDKGRQPMSTPHVKKSHKCRNCGGQWPHRGGQTKCPARDKQCMKCGQYNHFASVCQTDSRERYPTPRGDQTKRTWTPRQGPKSRNFVRNVEHEDEYEEDDEYVFTFTNLSTREKLPHFKVKILGLQLDVLADSGATVNLLSKHDFGRITCRPKLQPTRTKITPYGHKDTISVLGKFEAPICSDYESTTATFYVVEETEIPILGWSTSTALQLLSACPVNRVNLKENTPQADYPDLFTGLGYLRDIKVKLHIDTEVQPVAQRYRRIPFHVRKQVEEQIRRDKELGVIEKAEGPTPWVSPIVVVPKPKSPDKVRVCVDMRSANKAIKRERHATPTLDELKTMLSGAKVFSKLDLNQGYNQLELDEDSRYITTFATHLGLYRYKRLFFGVNSASEIFQEAIRQALNGLQGVVNISDDLLCFGSSQEDHDTNLRALFQRLREKKLTLNPDKCEFDKTSLDFMGHTFGQDGVRPSESKLKSILWLPTPSNASEVRSLLGMMNFCGAHFIPDYATLTHDLRELTKKTTPWSWTGKHDSALNKLKTALSNASTLSYFDPNQSCDIYTDASPVGISAVLIQDEKIIQFASRSLTPTEQRYSQTEREALAITWASEYFHVYIFGTEYTVYTDHKPLVTLFNNPRAQLSARIERWIMRVQPYAMTVKYRPGADNPADYLSRHPVDQQPSSREEKIAEEYLHYVVTTATPKSMSTEEVARETENDPTLNAVIEAILNNRWFTKADKVDKTTFKTLYLCRAELSLTEDNKIILKGNQIVLPKSLHSRAVQLAHSGHQGIVKTVGLLREKVWFSGMQKLVEETVRYCMTCQIATQSPEREPLKMSKLPDGPWQEVSADFGHLSNGQYLLVVTDEYSRYVIVDILESTSARSVIPHLDKIFAEFGIPHSLKTDNGPPFNSFDFATYASHTGFKHRKITPLWPHANAETERFMRTVKKTIKAAEAQQQNWKQEMYKFLLDYRSTPHSTTDVPPATAFFGRNLRNRLPELPAKNPNDDAFRYRDEQAKLKMKLYADSKAYIKPSTIQVGDPVLVRDPGLSKSKTPYNPVPLTVVEKKGSMVTAKRGNQRVTRNSSFFKPAPRHPSDAETEDRDTVPDIELSENTSTNTPTNTPHSPHTSTSTTHAPLRHSNRTVHMPSRFNDFVVY